jgi:hypothetical protein
MRRPLVHCVRCVTDVNLPPGNQSMPISVNCPSCGRSYNVKDDAAGKKFRCKQCEAVVSVPDAPAEAEGESDPWDNLDLSTAEDPYGDGETDEAPAQTPVRRRKKKAIKKSSGMPVSVIVAIACEVCLILLNMVGIVGNLMSQNVPGACGSIFRILIEVAAIIGYVQAQNSARWTSVALSVVGILFGVACGVGLMVGGPMLPPQVQQQLPAEAMVFVVAVIFVQVVIWGVIIGTLVTGSARDYFERG